MYKITRDIIAVSIREINGLNDEHVKLNGIKVREVSPIQGLITTTCMDKDSAIMRVKTAVAYRHPVWIAR